MARFWFWAQPQVGVFDQWASSRRGLKSCLFSLHHSTTSSCLRLKELNDQHSVLSRGESKLHYRISTAMLLLGRYRIRNTLDVTKRSHPQNWSSAMLLLGRCSIISTLDFTKRSHHQNGCLFQNVNVNNVHFFVLAKMAMVENPLNQPTPPLIPSCPGAWAPSRTRTCCLRKLEPL